MSEHPPPQEVRWPEGAIFTVGHSTLPIERFMAVLQIYCIERLVGLRTIPRSRHNPQFNGDTPGARKTVYVPLRGGVGIAYLEQRSQP